MLFLILFFLFVTFAVIVMSLLDRHISLIVSILLGNKTYLKQDIVESSGCVERELVYNPLKSLKKTQKKTGFSHTSNPGLLYNGVDKRLGR